MGQLESALTEQRQEMTDLVIENERQGTDIEERINAEVAQRAELATLQGRIAQVEGELGHAKATWVSENRIAKPWW